MVGYDSLTVQDFENANWRNVPKYVQIRQSHNYSIEYRAASQSAMDRGENQKALALKFLEELTGIHFDADKPDNPFSAFFVGNEYRTLIPTDLDSHELSLVKWLAAEAEEPELKARFNDILWIVAKDYNAGIRAIGEYIDAAKDLWEGTDNEFHSSITRATQLGAKLGRRIHIPQCKVAINELLTKAFSEKRFSRALSLLELLFDQHLEESEILAPNIRNVADGLLSENNDYVLHIALDLLRKVLNHAKKPEDSISIQEEEALLYERQADSKALTGNYLVASDFITKAISVLRQIGRRASSVELLEKKLLEYQELSVQNMSVVSTNMEFTDDDLNQYRAAVSGFGLLEALIRMSRTIRVRGLEETRKNYDETHEGLVFMRLVSTIVVTKKGNVVAKIPPVNFDDSSEEEERQSMHLFKDAALYRQADGLMIDVMREQIYVEHHPSEADFKALVLNHPFVERGHEILFARALKAGIDGDRMMCAHFLIPQLENSLRHILRSAGANVTDLKQDYTQDEATLGRIFSEHKQLLIELIGEEVYFNLKGLLISKYSTNLRNLSLHGLMTDDEFDNYEILYLWWLVLRIFLAPFRLSPKTQVESNAEAQPQTQSEDVSPFVETQLHEPPLADTEVAVPVTKDFDSQSRNLGFTKKSWGPSLGSWNLFLENIGPELEYLDTQIDINNAYFSASPRQGLMVRQGGHIRITGVIKDLPLSEELNPQGQVPFRVTLHFQIGEQRFSQACVTLNGLAKDFEVKDAERIE